MHAPDCATVMYPRVPPLPCDCDASDAEPPDGAPIAGQPARHFRRIAVDGDSVLLEGGALEAYRELKTAIANLRAAEAERDRALRRFSEATLP